MADTKHQDTRLAKGAAGTASSDRSPRKVSQFAVITERDVGQRVVLRSRFVVRSLLVDRTMVGRTFGQSARTARAARVLERAGAIYRKSQLPREGGGGGLRRRRSLAEERRLASDARFQDVAPRRPRRGKRGESPTEEVLVQTAHHGMLRVSVAPDGIVRVADRPKKVNKRRPVARAPERSEPPAGATGAESFTTAQMLEAGLDAFWTIAERWSLSSTEQCAMLQVSDSTRLRWRRSLPSEGETLLDRLQLILLTYQRVNELAGSEAESAALVRREGSALNAEQSQQTILEMLSVRSILEMNRHYLRLESEVSAW